MNPHVSSFMDAKGGVLHSLRGHFGFDLQWPGLIRHEASTRTTFFQFSVPVSSAFVKMISCIYIYIIIYIYDDDI